MRMRQRPACAIIYLRRERGAVSSGQWQTRPKAEVAPASHCTLGYEADLKTSSNNLGTTAQKALLTTRDLFWLRTPSGGSEGGERRWGR
jgi:hypothetical protein